MPIKAFLAELEAHLRQGNAGKGHYIERRGAVVAPTLLRHAIPRMPRIRCIIAGARTAPLRRGDHCVENNAQHGGRIRRCALTLAM